MYLCAQRSTPRISLGQIPKGYAGTRKTVAYIIGLIKEGAKDFCVRQTAIDILFENGVPPKDYLGEIQDALCLGPKQRALYTRYSSGGTACTRRGACWNCELAIAMT